MAVTKVLSKKMRLDRLINYVANPDKTDDYVLTYFYHCHRTNAVKQMLETKNRYSKRDGIQAFHIIQAFDRGEITPELAHQIGNEFIKEHLPDFEVVLGTHVDKEHIHNHIVLNSVSFMNGKKYHSTAQSYFREVRPISDRLCKEHGLSIIMESTGKAMSYVEWKLKQAGVYTEREFFELDLEECMANASEPGEVYKLMEARGYTVTHNSKYPTFTPYKSTHAYRAKRQGKSLTEDELFGIIDHDLRFGTKETLLCKREYVHCRPQVRITGYITIFPYWMYVLGFVGQGKRTNYRIDYSEVKKLKRYIKDHDFIEKYGIDNEDQLDAKERSINEEIERLTKTRIILNSKKKRKKAQYDALAMTEYLADAARLYAEGETGIEDEYRQYTEAVKLLEGIDREELSRDKVEVYNEISEVNRQLRALRSELTIIKNLRHDIPHIANVLGERQVLSQKEQTNDPVYREEEQI